MRVFCPQVGAWPQVYQPVTPMVPAAGGGVVAVVHPNKWVGAQPTCVHTVAIVPQLAGLVCGLAVTVVQPGKLVGAGHAQCVKGCVINVAKTFVSLPHVGTCPQVYQPVGPTGAGDAAAACGGVVAVVHPSKWVGAQPICVHTVAAVLPC
jgi:hypothetical protein